jgi:hypothetical protein
MVEWEEFWKKHSKIWRHVVVCWKNGIFRWRRLKTRTHLPDAMTWERVMELEHPVVKVVVIVGLGLDLSLVLAFCCGQEWRRAEVVVFVEVLKVPIGVELQFGWSLEFRGKISWWAAAARRWRTAGCVPSAPHTVTHHIGGTAAVVRAGLNLPKSNRMSVWHCSSKHYC